LFLSNSKNKRFLTWLILGAQTLVFASDFPHHDCFYPGAVEKIRQRADLKSNLVMAMLSDNPRRLYFGD